MQMEFSTGGGEREEAGPSTLHTNVEKAFKGYGKEFLQEFAFTITSGVSFWEQSLFFCAKRNVQGEREKASVAKKGGGLRKKAK